MTTYDTYYVTEDDAAQVEATLRSWREPVWPEECPEAPVISGPLKRLAAAVQSMWERRDGHAVLWTGRPYTRPVKGDEFPVSGSPLIGSEGRHSHMTVAWESTGGIWSARAWRLDANLHVEVDLTYGDTRTYLTDVRLRVTGREAGGTLYLDDGGLADLLIRPLRGAIERRALRDLGGVEVAPDDELSDMDDRDWFITMDHQRNAWRRGWGIEGENAPRVWLNASPYDIVLADGTELPAADSPAWIAGRGTGSPEPTDLPDPVPGQAIIVTEAIALLSPHRRDLVYPAPVGPVLVDSRGERIPVKSITRY